MPPFRRGWRTRPLSTNLVRLAPGRQPGARILEIFCRNELSGPPFEQGRPGDFDMKATSTHHRTPATIRV